MVLHQQDADARGRQRAHDHAQGFDLRGRQAAGGFVQQDEARLRHQRARDLQETLLGVLQQVCAPAQGVPQADGIDQRRGALAQ